MVIAMLTTTVSSYRPPAVVEIRMFMEAEWPADELIVPTWADGMPEYALLISWLLAVVSYIVWLRYRRDSAALLLFPFFFSVGFFAAWYTPSAKPQPGHGGPAMVTCEKALRGVWGTYQREDRVSPIGQECRLKSRIALGLDASALVIGGGLLSWTFVRGRASRRALAVGGSKPPY
jgi:hypothetical protein